MKKLMFAAAIAASAAAFADPINAISFENAAYESIDAATNLSARADNPDPGRTDNRTYFLYLGDGSDSSFVTNKGDTVTDKVTAYFAGLMQNEDFTNQKYLALDTEGGTLWRSIGQLTDNNDALGTARAVASTGTYLDTLVQFTVTEDEAPTVGADDKLAIWLQAGEGTTNLMVRANYWASAGEDPVATNFTVTGVSIEPGTWYRLTVKAIPSITSQGAPFPAFQIFIDGTSIAAATPQYDEDFQDVASARYAAGIGDLIAANKLFPTLAERPSDLEDVTLQGVGFQGTGAVDEIVWTEDNPISGGSTVEFTLTWGAGISAVSYTIDGTTTDLSSETSPYTIQGLAAGTAMTVNASAADWYVISSGTGAVTAVAGGTNEVVAVPAPSTTAAGATTLPADADMTKVVAWAAANGNLTPAQVNAVTWADEAYLLNTGLTTRPTFAITAIEEVSGGWQITVEAKAGETAIDLEDINGTLKVKTGATLSDLASATSETASFTVGQDGKAVITITGTGKNFIKAVVE